MTELLGAPLRFAAAVAIVLTPFWIVKHSSRVSIDHDDLSMLPSGYSEGGYSVDTSIVRIDQLKAGDVVAYHPTKESDKIRVARVLAVEGSTVDIGPKGALVDGTVVRPTLDIGNWSVASLRVPRGCVFVLADAPRLALDSMQLGPLPFANLVGRLKPVN